MATEKVSKFHPDKIADRIAGAIVDLACSKNEKATCAVEVLIGHGKCFVEIESSELFTTEEIKPIVDRISECPVELELISVKQDPHLAENQSKEVRCGDNGIFKGVPLTYEEKEISRITRAFDEKFPTDGKYILLPLIFPFSCRSLLVSYPSVRCRYFMDYCSIVFDSALQHQLSTMGYN